MFGMKVYNNVKPLAMTRIPCLSEGPLGTGQLMVAYLLRNTSGAELPPT